ncbi:MAG: tetratricopeptide repeat-containing serine/threonine-protein kinase, partial [Acidobacteriota bacterium]|nr:tetratricopeptide repeat-containing serine/threonine-protein kinase [Acidobacteriota bacterium]
MEQEHWQQVKNIFADAVRQKPEVRRQFLEEACDGDQEVWREVESLLSSYDDADSFLESPAVVGVAESFEAGIPQLAAGQTLGHYEIIRQIGKGGMGEVYLAHDETLDRKVAVKVLYHSFSRDESNLRRFVQEAKAASGLNHPNILVVHEIGETENAHYIVSEYVEGRTLREIVKEAPLSLPETLKFAVQIAGALAAAHEAHLVHRDIKPENIMVRPDGFVKVLDFGLAKLVERKRSQIDAESETKQQNITAKGVILGTVNYMSPEQAKGKNVDNRTDIFSFGSVLYEMITGHQPFAGESANETIAAILKSEPRPLGFHAANIPAELERIVSKCLRKNPDQRYRHIRDLLVELEALNQELEFEAKLEKSVRPDLNKAEQTGNETTGNLNRDSAEQATATAKQNISSAEYITNGIRQHKFASFFGMITVVVALAAYSYYAFFGGVAGQIDSIAVMPFVNASDDKNVEYLSDGMTENLISSLSKIPALSVKARSSVFLYKGKILSPGEIGEELNVQAVLLGRVVQRGEDLSLNLELVDVRTENVLWSEKFDRKMSDLVSLQSEIAREVSETLRIELTSAEREQVARSYTKNSEAQKLYLQGRSHWIQRNETEKPKTLEEFEKAIEYFEQAIREDPNFALAYSGLADVYHLMPMYAGGRSHAYMPLAKKAALKALKLDNELAEAHASYAEVMYLYDFDWETAEREYKRAIELDPNYATVRHWYSQFLSNKGMHDQAISEMSKALELEPDSKFFNLMMGYKYFFARRYDEAIAQYQRAIDLFPESFSLNQYLADCYQAKGMYAEAYRYFL